MRKAVRILKGGGAVIITQDNVDQSLPPTMFMGKKLHGPFGAARLAEITDSLILPVIVAPVFHRVGWTILMRPPVDPRLGSTKDGLVRSLEELVSSCPEVWDYWRKLR